jgi:hypothetical protein
MLRRNRELVLAAVAILAITSLYIAVVNRLDIPESKGFFGHSIGILGSILMIMTETLYSLRKRVIHRPWGRMNEWLRFHIFTGIVGPFLLLLHTAWNFHGLAGVLMLMTIVVVLSGFFGRYIYTAVPRTVDGMEIELEDLDARLSRARRELTEAIGEQADTLLSEDVDLKPSVAFILGRGLKSWRRRSKRWMTYRELQPEAREQAKRVDLLVDRIMELQSQRASLAIVRSMMASWYTLHVPLGMALFMAALFHIGAALYYATFLK